MDKDSILEISDADFADMAPPAVAAGEGQQESVNTPEPQPTPEPVQPVVTDESQQPETGAEPVTEADAAPVTTPVAETDPATPVTEPVAQPVQAEIDYKAAYEKLLQPIKANGKEIKLNSVEELVQLAQQGANYTRKMQDIAPHRKTLLMLENNGIDQDQLSFLIDLSKKDPAAIQKLLKDSNVNPLDIDVEAEPTYKGGNHQVTDEEAAFRNAIDDMQMSDSGQQVLQHINGTWDQASKELLVTQPEVMGIMREQHAAGFYERISAEIDRRRVLGAIPTGQTWLQSYKTVGDQMVAAGQLQDLVANQQPAPQTPAAAAAPVTTRVATPRPTVSNDARAAAAAPVKPAAKPAKTLVNPLSMSDEEFMKQFQNRL